MWEKEACEYWYVILGSFTMAKRLNMRYAEA